MPYLTVGGGGGFKLPPKFLDFFLKNEGKEVERKNNEKRCRHCL